MVSLILSNGELTTIVCALLEPQENPEIRQACQLLAAKLQPFLSSCFMSGGHSFVTAHFPGNTLTSLVSRFICDLLISILRMIPSSLQHMVNISLRHQRLSLSDLGLLHLSARQHHFRPPSLGLRVLMTKLCHSPANLQLVGGSPRISALTKALWNRRSGEVLRNFGTGWVMASEVEGEDLEGGVGGGREVEDLEEGEEEGEIGFAVEVGGLHDFSEQQPLELGRKT